MDLLVEKSISGYAELLASNSPAPGGGSTAAISGLMGSALLMMVYSLSAGKKSYEAQDEAVKNAVKAEYEEQVKLKAELEKLVDEDTFAFNKVMAAIKMPKETDEQKAARSAKLEEASEEALLVPLKSCEACLNVLKNAKNTAAHGNKNAVSDAGVGALMALAGLEGAALNVKINLPSVSNEKLVKETEASCLKMIEEGKKLQAEVLAIVNSRM